MMVKIDDEVYYCDPSKHTECTKTGCFLNGGSCRFTLHEEYADTTTDVAPVVRCENCKYWVCIEHEGVQHTACKLSENPRMPEYLYHPSAKDFCSRGERKDEVEE